MAESESLSDAHGQKKLEVWMNAPLRAAIKQRADELDISMAEYARRVFSDELGAERGAQELEA